VDVKARLSFLGGTLLLVAVVTGAFAGIGTSSANRPNIVLIYNGPAIANTHSAPSTAAFTAWCNLNGPCAPSVALPQYDAATGQLQGTIYVWTKNFVSAGGSTCFGEFVWYVTNGGDIYMDSGSNGTCGGGPIDPSLKQPTHVPRPGVVLSGGGDGTIVGGTGRFANWTGTYTDRGFFELGAGGSLYYDQLFWSINPA
jgi:hypothetical protein